MANTDITQRAQYERSDLLAGGEGIRRGSEKGAAIYSVIALVIGVVLAYAALKTIDQALLINHKMECASCHDVHKQIGSAPTSGIMVKISGNDASGRGSLICRSCHNK